MSMDPNKEKALQAALSQIERQFGKGTVMRLTGPGYRFGYWGFTAGSCG